MQLRAIMQKKLTTSVEEDASVSEHYNEVCKREARVCQLTLSVTHLSNTCICTAALLISVLLISINLCYKKHCSESPKCPCKYGAFHTVIDALVFIDCTACRPQCHTSSHHFVLHLELFDRGQDLCAWCTADVLHPSASSSASLLLSLL